MNIFELQQKLSQVLVRNISQADIAKALEVTRAAVNKRHKTNSSITIEEQKKIARYFNVEITLLTEEKIYDNQVSASIKNIPGEILEPLEKFFETDDEKYLDEVQTLINGIRIGRKKK